MSDRIKGVPLHTWILGSLVLGAATGIGADLTIGATPEGSAWLKDVLVGQVMEPVGQIFLAAIFMVVVPLLFSALVIGVSEIGDVAKFGRIGLRTLVMTVIFSSIAVGIAFLAVTVFQPGKGFSDQTRQQLVSAYQKDGEKKMETAKAPAPPDPPVLGFIPKNPILEASRALSGGILPFMVFALVFGIAMTRCDPERTAPLKSFLEGLSEVSQKMIELAMLFAPIGVFALIFKTGATLGFDLFGVLLKYALVVIGALALHQFVVYSILIKVIAKRNPMDFFRQMRNVMLTAFATSSSNATLPVALKDATEEVGLPRDVSSFVLTVGATANQNGTALFEGITLVFLCQLFGVEVGGPQIIQILGLSIVAGIGTAGVPGGSWPVIGSIAQGLGVPASSIGIVMGIDRILDMSRTVLNVTGDMAIACCVAAGEGVGSAIPEEAME